MSSAADRADAPGASGWLRQVLKGLWTFARHYWWLFMLVVLGAHLVLWIAANPQPQRVRWVFATTTTPLGVVIAVSVVFGAIMALLIRFQRHAGMKSSATDNDRQRGAQ